MGCNVDNFFRRIGQPNLPGVFVESVKGQREHGEKREGERKRSILWLIFSRQKKKGLSGKINSLSTLTSDVYVHSFSGHCSMHLSSET